MVFWEGYVSDEVMSTFVPIMVFWLYTGFYLLILPFTDKYRLHTREEEDAKNLVSLGCAVKRILIQQVAQAALNFWLISKENASESKMQVQPSIPVQIVQFIIAMLVLDTWQYFVHRYMHENKFLYRHIHSYHHRFVVNHPIASSYNHLLEGLIMDTIGGGVAFLASGMSARTSIYFFSFAVIKAIDDHCGLLLPANIFHLFFTLDTAYHDIHHQLKGFKCNYAQPFFPLWDKLLGTYKPYTIVKRPEGGFEARLMKD